MGKYLKLGVMDKVSRYNYDECDTDHYEIFTRVYENDISSIYKKYEDVTMDELNESVAKILYWMMKNGSKYIIVDLDKFNEELDCKKMTIEELEKKLDEKGIDILELIGDKLGYKVKIIEEVGKHEVGRSNKK